MAPWAAEPDELGVLGRARRGVAGGSGAQPSRAGGQLGLVDQQVEGAGGEVQADPVAVADERDRAAVGGLRRDVADAEPGGAAGEAAVGEQQDVLAQPGALDRAGDGEHLAHARAAPGPLVPDDDDVAGLQRALGDGVHRALLAVEDAGGALEHLGVEAGRLHDRAVGRQRAAQDRRAHRSCGSGRSSRG